jgi:hypothetical protein
LKYAIQLSSHFKSGGPGASKPINSNDTPAGRAFGQKLESFAAILWDAKVFNPPLGFQPRLNARCWYPEDCGSGIKTCNDWAVQAQIGLIVYYFVKENGKINWGGNANNSADIWVNDLRATLGQDYDLSYKGLPLPDGRHLSYMPSKSGEIDGFPMYDDKSLILSSSKRPNHTISLFRL